jgi:predicted amidophosphoribosyltransferase
VIAQKIAALCVNTLPFPSLRFSAERPNSREEGGSRSSAALYPSLELSAKLPAGQLILVDDVLTGGGHLRAAAWKLEDAGGKVDQAFCCGRSLETKLDDPFIVLPEALDISRS